MPLPSEDVAAHAGATSHTVEVTTLKHLTEGAQVNLEIDIIARYVERMLAWRDEQQ